MLYTIQTAAKLTGVSAYSIRYYDQRHLIPGIQRDRHNNRQFTTQSLHVLRVIAQLRATNMPLTTVQQYINLLTAPHDTTAQQAALLQQHAQAITTELNQLQANLTTVQTQLSHLQVATAV